MPEQGDERKRICDLGYLRSAYRRSDGRIGYRCASEPVEQYVAAGGAVEDTVGRRCLCNGLTAVIGQAQERAGAPVEAPLLTSGDGVRDLTPFAERAGGYTAADVVRYLLG